MAKAKGSGEDRVRFGCDASEESVEALFEISRLASRVQRFL